MSSPLNESTQFPGSYIIAHHWFDGFILLHETRVHLLVNSADCRRVQNGSVRLALGCYALPCRLL